MLCESGIDLDFDVFEEEQDRNYFEVKSKCLTPASNNPFVLMDLDLINVKPDPDAAANGGMGGAYGNTRANFKLHLQREHLIEEERKKVKYKHNVEAMQMFQQSNAMSFPQPLHQQQQQRTSPMKTLPSNLPTSVLKVETKLQNPTQYYIKQQQKRQVRDYLNQQQQQQNQRGGGSGGSGGPTMPVSAPSSLRNQQMFDFPSPPVTGYHSTSSHLSPASPDTTSSVASGGEVENTVFEDFLGLENNFGEEFGMFSDNMFPSTLPATNNLFETFAVAHNQNEKDEKISSSCPITVKQENPDGFVKDRQKKDNHNLIERRRRYNINDRIKELGTLVPKMDNDFKQNKGTILKSSVDYIRRLKKDRERMRMYEMRNMTLEDLNKKLSLRVQELELILRASNLSTILPEPSLAGNSSGNTPANHLAQLLQQQHQQQNNQQKYPSDLHRLLTKPSHSAPLPGTSSETVATTLSTSVDSPRFMDEEPIDTD